MVLSQMNTQISNDYRRENFRLAQYLANRGYLRILNGLFHREYFRVARTVNNLKSDLRNILRQDQLKETIKPEQRLWSEIEDLLRGRRELYGVSQARGR